jgi:hypothetical protein
MKSQSSLALALLLVSLTFVPASAVNNKGGVSSMHNQPRRPSVAATNTLECDNGKAYVVSVRDGSCRQVHGVMMLCDNKDGDEASATCNKGCAPETKGSGECKLSPK